MSLPPEEQARQARVLEEQLGPLREPEDPPEVMAARRFEALVCREARGFRTDPHYGNLRMKLGAVCAPSMEPHPEVSLPGATASEQALYRMGGARMAELLDEWADAPHEEETQ